MSKDFAGINNRVKALIAQGIVNPDIGTATKPIAVKIKSVNKHALKHGVTQEEAQNFINNAVVMFEQGNRLLFVSEEGNAVLLDIEQRLIAAYRKETFDPALKAILEVLENEY